MTQEEDLLLKYLCMALPYGVICKCYHTEFDEWSGKSFVAKYNDTLENIDVNGFFLAGGFSYEIDEIEPYLRPTSSMTDKEHKEYEQWLPDGFSVNTFYWLLENHFDFMGLIPKDLAIEVTEENNPYV